MGDTAVALNWFQQGGVVMYILSVFSFILIGITVEKIFKLSRLKCRFGEAEDKVLQLIQDKAKDKLLALSDKNPSDLGQRPIYLIGRAVAMKYSYAAIARALERDVWRLEEEVLRGIAWMASIGNVAPFVGLFGTVLGIIKAFHAISQDTEKSGLESIGRGISEALVATAAGLAVAIPAVLIYNLISRAVRARLVKIEIESREFLDRINEGGFIDA